MKEKVRALLEKKWIWSTAAFGIPFVVSIIICAGCGIYPFGDNCILHMDMYHQYAPFFMELRDKLAEGGSLLYSWNLGLGSDFIALYAYYLASPMNWLLILCPEGLVIEFMTVTTWFKIAFCGLFFFWFLKEHFHLVGKDGKYHLQTAAPALIFSTTYAFSGFVAAYSWNIMWMDSIALFPLIVMGLERLVKKNQPMLYYVSLALSILCNFYISLIICMFLVLYFGLLFLEKKKGKFKACVRFAWYSLLAGGTGAILLIPEALILGYAESADTTWPETVEWYFGLVEELSRMCVTVERYTGNDHWPNLYCGAFTVLLVILYVFNRRIRLSQKIPRLALLVLFITSFANNYLDYIWHGLRFPNSLPARQSFLFIFMMLLMGYETFRKRKGNRLWHVFVAEILCIIVLVLGVKKTDASLIDPLSFVLTEIFLLSYGICFILHKIGSKELRAMMRGFAFGLAMGEVLLNMGVTGFYSISRSAYLAKEEGYEQLLEFAEADAALDVPEGAVPFFRVEDYERKTKNDDSLYGYPSGTIFSSLMNIDVSHFYQSVYMEGGRNYYCYNGATPLVSSMLSVKYMLSDNDQGTNELRELLTVADGYYLYKNKYCLPLGFMMSESAVDEWYTADGGKIAQINNLAYALGAEGPMLELADVRMSVEEGETYIEVSEDGFYYGYYASCSADNLNISVDGGPVTRYNKTTHRYLFEFGSCEAGDTIAITNSSKANVSFTVYKLNMDIVDAAYEVLNSQTMIMEKYTDTNIKGAIDVKEAGRLIFSIPNESGWTLYVDGKETEAVDFQDTFISVHLDEGKHEIELRYMTPGLGMGAAISAGCVLLFVLTMVIRKKLVKRRICVNDSVDVCTHGENEKLSLELDKVDSSALEEGMSETNQSDSSL